MIAAAPRAYEAALMASYPGRGNPVLDALRGKISLRQLAVMLEHLPAHNAAERELAGEWDDLRWLAYDISCQLRVLNASIGNIFKKKGSPNREAVMLPSPNDRQAPTQSVVPDRALYEADLQKVLNRKNPH